MVAATSATKILLCDLIVFIFCLQFLRRDIAPSYRHAASDCVRDATQFIVLAKARLCAASPNRPFRYEGYLTIDGGTVSSPIAVLPVIWDSFRTSLRNRQPLADLPEIRTRSDPARCFRHRFLSSYLRPNVTRSAYAANKYSAFFSRALRDQKEADSLIFPASLRRKECNSKAQRKKSIHRYNSILVGGEYRRGRRPCRDKQKDRDNPKILELSRPLFP
jgi:hypothetical protein